MKVFLSRAYVRFLQLSKHFSHDNPTDEKRFFGLGQFVLLLTLTPFIFNLSLYDLSSPKSVATYYEHDPDRFTLQPLYPPEPVALKSHETRDLKRCDQFLQKNTGNQRHIQRIREYCKTLKDKNTSYQQALTEYEKITAFRQGLTPNFTCLPPHSCIRTETSTSSSYATIFRDQY